MAQLKTNHSHKNKAFSGFGCFLIYAKKNNKEVARASRHRRIFNLPV